MIPWHWTLAFLEGFVEGFLEATFVMGLVILVCVIVRILAFGLYILFRKEGGMS
jgi:hypothetical protein